MDMEYFQNQPALLHVRLLDSLGKAKAGILSTNVTVTFEKPDGTVTPVVLDGVNNKWHEVTTGAFAEKGKYDLTLAGSFFDQLGAFVVAVDGVVASSLILAKTVLNVWEEQVTTHPTAGTMGGLLGTIGSTDVTPPVVALLSPGPGSTITATTPLEFQVTDPTGLRLVIAAISFQNGSTEMVYDGSSLRAPYTKYSSVTSISTGLHFIVRRDSSWPATPKLEVYATDVRGNET